jgi:DNA replication and repair protein RecF
MAAYGSEGQSRLGSLALRLSSAQYLAQVVSDSDIVLLVDDVFGELDSGRRAKFFDLVQEAGQVVVACTSVPSELAEKGRSFTMAGGQLTGE